MSEYTIKEFRDGQFRVRVEPDIYYEPADTREEPLSSIVTWRHDDTGIGDRGMTAGEQEAYENGGWEGLVKHVKRHAGALVVMPLSGISHSGESVWIASSPGEHSPFDPGGWDSGQWGFVMVTRLRAEEFGIPGTPDGLKLPYTDENGVTVETLEQEAERQARGEVEEYNDALTGNVFSYVIEKLETWAKRDSDETREEWETVDSCSGFVGDADYCMTEGKAALEGILESEKPKVVA